MDDGEILEAYLNSKRTNKKKFAETLDMSKQNLYQLFQTRNMQPETKTSLEAVIGLKWDKISQVAKQWVNIDGNTSKRNGSTKNAPDYRDDIISLLKEKLNLSERKALLYLQTNNALLKTILQTVGKIQAKVDKRKLEEILVELNNITESHLRDEKIGGN